MQNLSNGQISSFSIHQFAERNGANPQQLEEHCDEFEREMLNEFYVLVEKHLNHKWLHWNMRDVNYGFQAIEHRCKVVKGNPKKFPKQIYLIYQEFLLIFMNLNTHHIQGSKN